VPAAAARAYTRDIVIRLSLIDHLRVCAGRRRRLVLALFALLLIAQTALMAHSVEHIGRNAECALCVAADHHGGPTEIVLPVLLAAVESPFQVPRFDAPTPVLQLAFQPRAPPRLYLS
jgi:hypothetical protein